MHSEMHLLALLLGTASAVSLLENAQSPPNYPSPLGGRLNPLPSRWDKAYEKARSAIMSMSVAEKVNLTTGTGFFCGPCLGNTGSVPRLGMRGACLQDGPIGVRLTDYNSAFGAGVTAASSFNKELVEKRGIALGKEFKAKGVDVMLGPVVGPLGSKAAGGRNWEGFGSDPYLAGVMAAHSIKGTQSQKVLATIKHLIGNEQEQFRLDFELPYGKVAGSISANIDDRTMHEIYLWPFADAVKAGAAAAMCAYNMVNNSYSCQNSKLLNGLLKDELGFEGFVMTDWMAAKSGVASALSGLDMMMPGETTQLSGKSYWGSELTKAVANGSVPITRLDDMVTRILASYYSVGVDLTDSQRPNFHSFSSAEYGHEVYLGDQGPIVKYNDHVQAMSEYTRKAAYQSSLEGIILLKNDHQALPLRHPRSISILGLGAAPDPVGANCAANMDCSNGAMAMGWGSGTANFPYLSTPLEAITEEAIKRGISVTSNFETFENPSDLWKDAASKSDVNILFVLTDSGEGFTEIDDNLGDRKNFTLWHNGEALINHAAATHSNNVVVVSSVGPVDMEGWIENENITAVLFTGPSGQDFGNSVSDVLFGKYNPSGHLPFTIAKNTADYEQILTSPPEEIDQADWYPQDNFDRGLLIDYRYFDKENLGVRFPFGFGLSYTTFEIKDINVKQVGYVFTELPSPPKYTQKHLLNAHFELNRTLMVTPENFTKYGSVIYPWVDDAALLNPVGKYTFPDGYSAIQKKEPNLNGGGIGGNPALWATKYIVEVSVENTGELPGAFVGQLYLSFPDPEGPFPTPPKQLRGFEKIELEPSSLTTVQFPLLQRDLSVWDTTLQQWIVQKGEYKVHVGLSSRDIQQVAAFIIS